MRDNTPPNKPPHFYCFLRPLPLSQRVYSIIIKGVYFNFQVYALSKQMDDVSVLLSKLVADKYSEPEHEESHV